MRNVVRQPGMAGKLEVASVASLGTEFSGQHPDKGKLGPLGNLKRPEQLSLGVFQRQLDRIRGGNGQLVPRAENGFSSKVLRIEAGIKSIRRGVLQFATRARA